MPSCPHALMALLERDRRDADAGACQLCGSTLSGPDRDVRFSWPDALFTDAKDGRIIDGLWLSHDSAASSVMMRARGMAFLRVLVPARQGTQVQQLTAANPGARLVRAKNLSLTGSRPRGAASVRSSPSGPELGRPQRLRGC